MMRGMLIAAVGGGAREGDPVAVVVAVSALILVVVGAGLAVMQVRSRLLRKQDDRASTESWLDELRAMHRRGEVSDEEFASARASLLAKVTGGAVPGMKRVGEGGPGVASGAEVGSVRRARPGFDLTGVPLPRAGGPIGEGPGSGGGAPGARPPHSSPDDPPSQAE